MRVFLTRLARNAAGLSGARPRGTACAALIALIVTAGGIASAAGPASAAASATISRPVKLAAQSGGIAWLPANSNGGDSPRHIYLAKGTYTWDYSFTGEVTTVSIGDHRQISLAAGWYSWSCDLVGTFNAYPANNYSSQCVLAPDNHNLAVATLPAGAPDFDLWAIPPDPFHPWNWVSNLIPNF
jgi:hypothetical protein